MDFSYFSVFWLLHRHYKQYPLSRAPQTDRLAACAVKQINTNFSMKVRSFWPRKVASSAVFHALFNELGFVHSFSLHLYSLSITACQRLAVAQLFRRLQRRQTALLNRRR